MKNESAAPITEQPIYTQFTCPDCGGHFLKAKVECDANVTGFDDRAAYFILDKEQEPALDVALFFCQDCDWNTDEESFVRDYMK